MRAGASLEDMISHRMTFELADGRRLVGYLAGLEPGRAETGEAPRWRQDSPGACARVAAAQLLSADGRLLEEQREVRLMLSSVVSYRVTEGPGGF